jgi:hypothetical protein
MHDNLKFKQLEDRVATFVEEARCDTSEEGLTHWRFGDREVWFEKEGHLRLLSRTGNGIRVELKDDPGDLNPWDILAHDPADVAALIAEALIDDVESVADAPQWLA